MMYMMLKIMTLINSRFKIHTNYIWVPLHSVFKFQPNLAPYITGWREFKLKYTNNSLQWWHPMAWVWTPTPGASWHHQWHQPESVFPVYGHHWVRGWSHQSVEINWSFLPVFECQLLLQGSHKALCPSMSWWIGKTVMYQMKEVQ